MIHMFITKSSKLFLNVPCIICLVWCVVCLANPSSKPYVPYRTSPFEQSDILNHNLEIPPDDRKSIPKKYKQSSKDESSSKCPLQFNLGLSQRAHHVQDAKRMAITEPPSIYPVHASLGPGRQVIHSTQYEHLDVLTTSSSIGDVSLSTSTIKEGLVEHQDFPLLFESSSFLGSPLIHDTNGDGIIDAVLADYDGGIYFIGLQVGKDNQRYFHRAQIPRLYVRRDWMINRLNETAREAEFEVSVGDDTVGSLNNDPYHSYFEYGSHENTGDGVLQGVAANVLGQDHKDMVGLESRRKRKVNHENQEVPNRDADNADGESKEGEQRRRLEEAVEENTLEGEEKESHDFPDGFTDDIMGGESQDWPDDDNPEEGDYDTAEGGGDDIYPYHGYDDYYIGHHHHGHNDYYDDKHYIRIPPHVLSSPVLADMKKIYSNDNEREEMIFLAVSYYFDEDEYEGHFSYKRFENIDVGDESEMERGIHVASALIAYVLDETPRFGREEHLDLSGDPTAPHNYTMLADIPMIDADEKLGAFALGTPTVADIDGNGEEDVLIGTSMGIIYCLHARHMYNIDGWPVQIKNAVESRILLEDVIGDTNLEVFILDVAANIYCFDTKGQIIWRRDLINSIFPGAEIRGLSPMTLGDVDGDGLLDIVLTIKVITLMSQWSTFVVAISASTGEDIKNFPMEFDSPLLVDDGSGDSALMQKLPQPLLIDLHGEQNHWKDYIARNGTSWKHPTRSKESVSDPHGGSAPGLHIVQPIGSNLYIIEGGSGCTQMISIGEEITAMVQADDVHGTNNIDLVISTKTGNIITLDSPAVPYHPLNVWNSGEVRGRRNNFAQGFTASQGIFVHEMSRQYRDIFGVYVPITFEIFDNRPNAQNEKDKQIYNVEMRDGTSAKRPIFRKTYNKAGVYTERVYINYGPGYYTITVLLRTSHGLIYEDVFHLGYNVHYMDGLGTLLWLPLSLAAILIFICSKKKIDWDDDEYDEVVRGKGRGRGILDTSS